MRLHMALFSQLKQVKDLRKQAKEYKDTMGDENVTGEGGGGIAKVTIDGTNKIQGIELSEDALTPENKDKLEKAIVEAGNDAQKKLQKVMMKKFQSGELKMPEMGS